MRTETVEGYLDALATRAPAPGGGTAAALHAAHGAALVASAARLGTDGGTAGGPSGAADVLTTVRRRGDEYRAAALDLADRGDLADRDDTAGPGPDPVRVIALTERVLALAETLRPVAPRAVLPDVAAAAEVLRAAAGTARVRLEAVLPGLTDAARRAELFEVVDHVDDLVLRAAKVTAAVREQLLR